MTEKINYITKSTIKSMGFTDKMFRTLIKEEPLRRKNPHYSCAPEMCLWDSKYIEGIMESEEYKKMYDDYLKKGKVAAEKALKTKYEKADKLLASVIKSIKVKKISNEELRNRVLEEKQDWYDYIADERGYYDDYKSAYSADEKTIKRWEVNYIRHNLTQYDHAINRLHNKVGKTYMYVTLLEEIYKQIKEAYPELAKECDRQYENKTTEIYMKEDLHIC